MNLEIGITYMQEREILAGPDPIICRLNIPNLTCTPRIPVPQDATA